MNATATAQLTLGLVSMARPAGTRVGRRNPAFDPLLATVHQLVAYVKEQEAAGNAAARTSVAMTVDINAALDQLKGSTTPDVLAKIASGDRRADDFVMGRLRSFLAKRVPKHSFTIAVSQEDPNLLGVWYNGEKTAEEAAADAAAADADDAATETTTTTTAEAPAVPAPGKGKKAAAAEQ